MYEKLIKALRELSEWDIMDYEDGCGYANSLIKQAADAIEELSKDRDMYLEGMTKEHNKAAHLLWEKEHQWISVKERLPECDLGAEVGNIEWISCGMVHAGCFGRVGKYRDAYFRTWTDAGEGMDAKDADYWRAVALPESPKEEQT